jgi:transposase
LFVSHDSVGFGSVIREGSMRGADRTSGALFSYVEVEARIQAKHPLRAMRRMTNAALAELDGALYETIGRPSIAPERLLRATLLQLLYSIRSERQLVAVSLVRRALD